MFLDAVASGQGAAEQQLVALVATRISHRCGAASSPPCEDAKSAWADSTAAGRSRGSFCSSCSPGRRHSCETWLRKRGFARASARRLHRPSAVTALFEVSIAVGTVTIGLDHGSGPSPLSKRSSEEKCCTCLCPAPSPSLSSHRAFEDSSLWAWSPSGWTMVGVRARSRNAAHSAACQVIARRAKANIMNSLALAAARR